MGELASALSMGVVCLALVAATESAGGLFRDAPDRGVVILSAEQLATARKHGIPAPGDGPWHAWAWQRGGVEVAWSVGGQPFKASASKGKEGQFAWVKLGTIAAEGGKPLAVKFTPASLKPAQAAVAVLALAKAADWDPEALWRVTRVFPDGVDAAGDARPGVCHHLNERFSMPAHKTRAAWERRAAWLRDHVRASSGLLPEPERTPLKPRVFDKLERDGYTIEKAFIESYPGFYCTGNLYRPRGKQGPFPAIACPHGHWKDGRFGHEPPRGSVFARCITLARMGYVVFSYDMVGYNDSGKQTGGHSGVFASAANELWGLSTMHLQSWNTIRTIDFLQSLPDVDADRIGLTGCSGGGTQTFMVMGIDPRVKAAAPVNMISGIMQGGCECENAPLLRIESNNIEIGALMAPRPLILCSVTGDWTRETPKVEYPSIRGVYELYGATGRVSNVHDKSPHGYNKVHRLAVYRFFETWLRGAKDAEVTEPPYSPEKKEDLLVFGKRPLPKDAKKPKALAAHVVAECRKQRDALLPKKPQDRQRFLDTLGAAYTHAILAELPSSRDVTAKVVGRAAVGDVEITRLMLGRKAGLIDAVPALLYRPKTAKGKGRAVLVVHPQGKAGLVDPVTAKPDALLDSLLAAGTTVLAIDTYLTGEFHSPFATTKQKSDKKYSSTYNRTAMVQRVQDILTALAYLGRRPDVASADVVGYGEAGAWCLLAAPFAPEGTRVVADLMQFKDDDDPRWLGDLFTPCILKAGGLDTAVALAAPRPLFLHNVAPGADTASHRAAFRAAGRADALRIERRECGARAIAAWLSGK